MTKVSGTIKALEWVDLHGDGTCYQVSNCNALHYYSCITSRGRLGWGYNNSLHHTLAAAKAAAQADYEARILAAIQPDPETMPVACISDHTDMATPECPSCGAFQEATPSSAGIVSVEAAAPFAPPGAIMAGLESALEACVIIDAAVKGDHENVDELVEHLLSAATPALKALRALAGERVNL